MQTYKQSQQTCFLFFKSYFNQKNQTLISPPTSAVWGWTGPVSRRCCWSAAAETRISGLFPEEEWSRRRSRVELRFGRCLRRCVISHHGHTALHLPAATHLADAFLWLMFIFSEGKNLMIFARLLGISWLNEGLLWIWSYLSPSGWREGEIRTFARRVWGTALLIGQFRLLNWCIVMMWLQSLILI